MTFTKERIIEDLKASTQNASGMFEISEETICALMSLLTAPRAPVVPDEMPKPDTSKMFVADAVAAISRAEDWNACRTAMLQGGEHVTTANKLPDGWVACSERMPGIGTEIFYFCQDDGLRDCGIVSSSNFSGRGDAQLYVHAEGYDLRFGVDITHRMPLPAAPRQEVK